MIEESPRRDVGLDDLAGIWAKVTPATEEEGVILAIDELRAMRKERRGEGPAPIPSSSRAQGQ